MKWALGLSALTAVLAVGGAVTACNAVLGIDAATREPEGGTSGGANCNDYCAAIMQNCTGPNSEYESMDICMAMCVVFDTSNATPSDTGNNDIACHTFFAQQAATTPNQNCEYAGPLGGGHCGTNPCQNFCDLATGYCTGDLPKPYPNNDCPCACAAYTYLLGGDAGDLSFESGNTLNCRLYHLQAAYGSDMLGKFHCPHTGQQSATCH
jgi:hypothetical protein